MTNLIEQKIIRLRMEIHEISYPNGVLNLFIKAVDQIRQRDKGSKIQILKEVLSESKTTV